MTHVKELRMVTCRSHDTLDTPPVLHHNTYNSMTSQCKRLQAVSIATGNKVECKLGTGVGTTYEIKLHISVWHRREAWKCHVTEERGMEMSCDRGERYGDVM